MEKMFQKKTILNNNILFVLFFSSRLIIILPSPFPLVFLYVYIYVYVYFKKVHMTPIHFGTWKVLSTTLEGGERVR